MNEYDIDLKSVQLAKEILTRCLSANSTEDMAEIIHKQVQYFLLEAFIAGITKAKSVISEQEMKK